MMFSRLLSICFLVFILLFTTCTNELTVSDKDYPFVVTGKVSNITDTSVVFSANILAGSNDEIIEYGFIWDSDEPFIETANKIDLGTDLNNKAFSKIIDYNLKSNTEQYVKAYIKTQNQLIYGNSVAFTSKGSKTPRITDFYPKRAYVSSEITVIGENFSPDIDMVSVYYGDNQAQIISCDTNEIVFKVPVIDRDSDESISIIIYNKQIVSEQTLHAYTYWDKVADFPGEKRYGAMAFSIGEMGYVGCGGNYNYEYFNDFWAYNTKENKWVKKSDFPGDPRKYGIGFSYNGKGYIGLGYNKHTGYNDIWEYDPISDSWELFLENENLDSQRDAFFIIGDSLYLFGYYRLVIINLVTKDVSDIRVNEIPMRIYSVGFSNNHYGYVFSGYGLGHDVGYLKDLWEYNTLNNTWTLLAKLPGDMYRESSIGFSLSNRLFMGLGGFISVFSDFYEFDKTTNNFIKIQSLPAKGRTHAVSFVVDDKAYVGTGFDEYIYSFSDFYCFDPNKIED